MKLRWKLGIAVPMALVAGSMICWHTMGGFRDWVHVWVYFVRTETRLTIHSPPPRCKAREAELGAKENQIRRDAENSLKIGSKKKDVIQFFASEKIPVTFSQIGGDNWAEGGIDVKGDAECFSLPCGDDAAWIDVHVDLDENGTVSSEPVVGGMYTDCL